MKFNTRINLVIILSVITLSIVLNSKISTSFSTNSGDRVSMKARKAMSYLGFMSSIKSSFQNKFRQSPAGKKKKQLTLEKKDEVASMWNCTKITENWLQISSPSFNDKSKFPELVLPDNTRDGIKVDDDLYRINDAFDNHLSSGSDKPPTRKSFYFRLTGTHIYYSSSPTDYNILGSITISRVASVGASCNGVAGNGQYCIKVIDAENQNWKLCATDEIVRKQWLCRMQFTLQMAMDTSCFNGIIDDEYDPISNVQHVIKPIILIPTPSRMCNENWDYQKKGKDWECDCAEGLEQSPINLPPTEKAIDSSVKPLFQYQEVSVKIVTDGIDGQAATTTSVQMKLEKAIITINHDNLGRLVTMDGAIYQAKKILIHTPAEHKINYKTYPMEVQIIHYGISVGDIMKQVVLSFIFEKTPGAANKFFDDLDVYNLPKVLTPNVDLQNNININSMLYQADYQDTVISKPFSFYTYQGSLPMPPCTENTIVLVASKPLGIGSTALALLQESLRVPDMRDKDGNMILSNFLPENNRREQKRNDRPVYHYDHTKYCNSEAGPKAQKTQGHYEKFTVKSNKYMFVNSMNVSGVPGSLVVSADEALGKPIDLNGNSDKRD